MIWITADDVIMIHSRIIQVTGGIDGLRDRAGLEAAIAEKADDILEFLLGRRYYNDMKANGLTFGVIELGSAQ